MLQRELRKTLRAPLTWVVTGLAALLTGHGFVLAIDLFTAGSRAVAASSLLSERFDPLAGIVRPLLGSASFGLSLLGPLVACRVIAVEKERRTWESLLFMRGSALALASSAGAAALLATVLPLLGVGLLLLAWLAAGGHLDASETFVAFAGHALFAGWLAMLALMASSWTENWAQASVVTLVVVMASWAIDSSSGFAALAWLGSVEALSPSVQLIPFERGALAVGPALYFTLSALGFFGASWAAGRLDLSLRRRAALGATLAALGLAGAVASTHLVRVFDLTSTRRLSFSAVQADAVRALPGPLTVEVELDRDDARRAQLSTDFLFKLRLARPDVTLLFPRDGAVTGDTAYGRVRFIVAGTSGESFSSGTEELLSVLFETAGRPMVVAPDAAGDGWPCVIEGATRTMLVLLSYFLVPGACAAVAAHFLRQQRRRT